MLHMGNIFFPLIVAPFKHDFLYVETCSIVQKLIFDVTDTNILRGGGVFIYCLLCN